MMVPHDKMSLLLSVLFATGSIDEVGEGKNIKKSSIWLIDRIEISTDLMIRCMV